MGTLTIQRARDTAAIFRRMTVLVDGEVVARLRRGDEHVHTLRAGEHAIQAKMDWATSEPLLIDATPGDHVSIQVAIRFTALVACFTRPSSSLEIRRT